MRWTHLCGTACIASLLPSGASADLIFDQSINLRHGGRLSEPSLFQVADDFQLQSGASTVTDVHWWGGYFDSNTATEPDDFAIRIFVDIGGTPGVNPINEFVVGNAASRVDTGVFTGFIEVYSYSANISPLTLSANTTYWLSILNDTAADTDDIWVWSYDTSATAVPFTAFRGLDGQSWVVDDVARSALGFQLTNDALVVPEPAAWALSPLGSLASVG